jgi:CheY-like chemotaxis protein
MARVLVIEDVEAVRTAIAGVLRTIGRHDVSTAGDVAQALALMADQPVDVVVTDIWMPGEDGIDFLRKARERHPDLPVIVVTGGGPKFPPIELTASVVEAHGADVVLIKPFEDEDLLAAVAQLALRAP